MSDRLDRINHENYLRGNLIKWWNVQIIPAQTEDTEDNDYEEVSEQLSDAAWNNEQIADDEEEWNIEESKQTETLNEEERMVVEQVLQDNSNESAYEMALKNLQLEEAKDIYERLLREAQEDEEKKQKEIEEAKKTK